VKPKPEKVEGEEKEGGEEAEGKDEEAEEELVPKTPKKSSLKFMQNSGSKHKDLFLCAKKM
jgi:hypothetical protein